MKQERGTVCHVEDLKKKRVVYNINNIEIRNLKLFDDRKKI